MMYDIIGSGVTYEKRPEFMTIGNLIELCLDNPEKTFRFVGTEYTVGHLHSWRGSYDLPAISYEEGADTGADIAQCLLQSLTQTHHGYKGGEYKYTRGNEFYVAEKGCSEEYKVCGYEIDEDIKEVLLLTKLDPY